ncbi:global transactivator [Fusarium pseudocircinatum]|uniref:Global transactivator n=1 Tax=Fusarium pseudocircinatum TaxID=56676 RepID=A0A8H5V084_9HYPO|nr:global transactivator [Fusarium pseudocircinatum]
MKEPKDPILEAAAEITATAQRLQQLEPPCPVQIAQNGIGWLRPGEGFVMKRETPTLEHNEDEEQDTQDSDPHEDEDQDDGNLEDEWTDALAVTSGYDEQEFIRFFDEINDDIVAKYRAPNPGPIPGLKDTVRLFDRQSRAVAAALRQKDSRFRGMILADPPGFGKTLSALATISVSMAKSGSTKSPCVIVAPLSCCNQWMAEIERFFGQDQMPAVCLVGKTLSPTDLWKYKVVVTSYSYLSAEVTRRHKFLSGIDDYKKGIITQPPKRPNLVLLSGIHEQEPRKPMGEWLILDEAHAIKNHQSRTYHAVSALREKFNACLMMTATPLDNSWTDLYALVSMLKGHPITGFLLFNAAFRQSLVPAPTRPEGLHKQRYIQLLDAVSLQRPHSAISDSYPPFDNRKIIIFSLTPEDRRLSNESFQEFKRISKSESETAGWKHLAVAHQYSYHPMLAELKSDGLALELAMCGDQAADVIEQGDEIATDHLIKWRERLEVDENWLSRRVEVVLDVVYQHIDRHPDHSFLIVDESVYFLDILAIAFKKAYEPVPYTEYNGRLSAMERHLLVQKASETQPPQIILASRVTGGQDINPECFNVLIQWGPWWKVSWEVQTLGLLCRPGGMKPVFVYELVAEDCDVENHKIKVRNTKNKLNTELQEETTRSDDTHTDVARRRMS